MSSRRNDRSTSKRLAIWFFVLLLLIPFGAYQITLNRQSQLLWQARQDAYEYQYQKNRRAEFTADLAFAQAHRGKQPTVHDAEVLLNGGRPFPTTQEGSETVLVYTDPNTGGDALLGTNGDHWTNVTTAHLPLPSMSGGYVESINVVRRLAYMALYVAWFAVMCFAIDRRLNHRRRPWRSGIDLIGLAIVSTTLALLGPNPRRALGDFFQDDSAAWGIVAIGLTAVFWLTMLIRKRRKDENAVPHCQVCGYNLTGNQSGTCPECGADVTALV